jgi:hypothetical protein
MNCFQDAEAMSRPEKEFLVRSFMGDDGSTTENSNEINPPVPPPPISTANETTVLPPPVVEEQSTPMNTQENNIADNTNPAEEVLTEDQNFAISQFCEMTGSDPSYAKTVLDVTLLALLCFAIFNDLIGNLLEFGNRCLIAP